ncbi:mucin-2 isoform X6 [Etheostoma spectabile]|uniref:mucin-2 isoform X6 n=1 Tax=Etheostoma spectabile TaxID=54343 RepID=UPI0013AF897C|nr:mucin-2-like isoform X6 [Etheostoma spectabile]
MSADDFQTKYSSVMEGMLKGAIAETTKLFETMVDELKAELSKIKKENEELKTKCSQFENVRNQLTVDTRESEPPPGPSDGSEKRDRAVQCDLAPVRTVLVEQCQPLRHSSLENQEQQCRHEEIEYYSLQDHNYGEPNTQRPFILVKQEVCVKQEHTYDDSPVQSVLVQEKVEPIDNAGSPWASACGAENEGPHIKDVCSIGEIPLRLKDEEDQVALELPSLEMDIEGAQNQSPGLEHSLVISLAAIKDNMEEESQGSQKISETHEEPVPLEKLPSEVAQHQQEIEHLEKEQPSVVPQICQRAKDSTTVNKQSDVSLQRYADVQSTNKQLAQPTPLKKGEAFEELKTGVAVGESSPQPELIVRRKRGRPPKTAGRLNQQVKELCSPPVLLESSSKRSYLSRRCSSAKEKPSESQQLSMGIEEQAVQARSTEVSSVTETRTTVQPRGRCSSVTLQDAMLLVEAMNQSTVENTFSSSQIMAAPPQTQCAPSISTLKTVDEVPAEPQKPPCSHETHEVAGNLPITEVSTTTVDEVPAVSQTPPCPVETHEAAGNLAVTEASTTTQSTIQKLGVAPGTADATLTNKVQAHIKAVILKQKHLIIPSNTTTSSMPSPAAAAHTCMQSYQQHPPHPLITSLAASKPGKAVPRKITAKPKPVSSLMPHKIAKLFPNQLPIVVSTIVGARRRTSLSHSPTAGLPPGTLSLASDPQKTTHPMSSKMLAVVPSQSTATSTDPQSGPLPHSKITIVIPRQMSAVESKKRQSQSTVPTAKQDSAKSSTPVTVSLSQLSPPLSQELSISMDTQNASDKVGTKLDGILNLESPKPVDAGSKTINECTETCSNLNRSVELESTSPFPAQPTAFEKKLTPVVRLTRLPFPLSPKQTVVLSRLLMDGSSKTQSIFERDTTQKKPSSEGKSTQPAEALVLSIDICPIVKETSVPLSANTSEMSEKPNDVQKMASLSSNTTILEESNSTYVQPSTPSKVRNISTRAGSGAADPTFNIDEEIFEDCALPTDPPIDEKQLSPVIRLTSITTKKKPEPQLQMTQAQFLAQLRVSPVTQEPKQASSDPTSSSDKKRFQRKGIVAKLRSHFKLHLQARRTATNPEPNGEMETPTVNDKKLRLEKDSPKNSGDSISICPRRSGLCRAGVGPKRTGREPIYVSSRKFKATRKPTRVSPRRSSTGRNCAGSKTEKSSLRSRRSSSIEKSANSKITKSSLLRPRRSSLIQESASSKMTKSTLVSPRRSSSIKEKASSKKTNSTLVSPRRSISIKDKASSEKTKSTSVSPRRSGSIKEKASSEKTKSTSVSPRRSGSLKEKASSEKTKSTSVSPRRSGSIKDKASCEKAKSSSVSLKRSSSINESSNSKSASPKKTKSTSVSPRRSSSSIESANSKKTVVTPVSPRRSSLIQEHASSKNTKPTSVSPRMSRSVEESPKTTSVIPMRCEIPTTPKLPTKGTNFFCRRKCTLTKDGSSSQQDKREANSSSPSYSMTVDDASTKNKTSDTSSPSVGWPKSATDGFSPGRTGDSTPPKKPRLIQDGPGPQMNLRVANAKKLAKAAKAKTIAKMKNARQSQLQNVAKTNQLAESSVSCETVRKIKVTAVWTPPLMTSVTTTPPEGKEREPGPKDQPIVSPPSVPRFPMPVRAAPFVSPLQPLSVIGRRLLKNQCGECGRVLSSIAALESHVSLHKGHRPFSCTLCGKNFPDSKCLKRHGRVHRNGRIHICQKCGKGFVYSFGLTKHLQMVHTRIKPFICQVCNKGFLTKRDVEAHIRIHTGEKPFHCDLCGRTFTRKVELNVHLRWHNGEKRHWCPYCGKGFLDFNNLKRHKYIHTGERPHACPHCPKHFTQSGHVKKHVKNVHKIQ